MKTGMIYDSNDFMVTMETEEQFDDAQRIIGNDNVYCVWAHNSPAYFWDEMSAKEYAEKADVNTIYEEHFINGRLHSMPSVIK